MSDSSGGPDRLKLRAPHAIVFDLDGTLIDSKGDIAAACNVALASVGRAPLSVDTIAAFVGDGARLLVARALALPPEHAEVERALKAFHEYYEAHPADHTTLLPGVREALDALVDLPLALVTNKPRGATIAVLAAFDLGARFASIRTGSDGPLKPDPAAIHDALKWVRVAAKDAWMVGDGEQDIRAGRAAGCGTIGVRGGFHAGARLEACEPDAVIDSLVELSALRARI